MPPTKPFQAFVPNFRVLGGKHCQSAALRQMLAWRGLDCSEALLLGLGGGIGFIYWSTSRQPVPFIGTRNAKVDDFVVNILRRLGGDAVIRGTASDRKADAALKATLARGEPACLFADMAYLPYLALPTGAHFGGHAIVVYGLDEVADRVAIADRGACGVSVTVAELRAARASQHPPFPARNRLATLIWPPVRHDLIPGIRAGLRESVAAMLTPPIRNFGLPGLEKWADLVPQWGDRFPGERLLPCLLNTYIYIEIGGTGGQAFRPLYAEFLTLAASTLNCPDLLDAAELCRRSARQWQELAESALPDWWPELGRLRALLAEKNRVFEDQPPGALAKMAALNEAMAALLPAVVPHLRGERLTKLLSGLRAEIFATRDAERELFGLLARVAR